MGAYFVPPPEIPPMPLSDPACKNAKPKEKPYKLADEKGMFLLINPNGSKYFRLKYRFAGKEKVLALGVYPETSLKEARDKRDTARKQIADGTDPSEIRSKAKTEKATAIDRQQRIENGIPLKDSFKEVALAWLDSTAHKVKPHTLHKKQRRFELHVFPVIGDNEINAVTSPDVYKVIKPLIEAKGLETAHRTHAEISSVFAYAIAHGITTYDPAQAVARQIPAQKVKHRAALTEPKDVGQLLRDIYCYQGTFVVQCALRFSPLVFQRPGEIRQMEWKDVDLDVKETLNK